MQVYQLACLIATNVKISTKYIQSRLTLSDSQLVTRAKKGDDEAFCEIVRRYQRFVYRQAWAYLNDDEAAKDAAQDVFLIAYEGIPYLRENTALRRWLYQICRNHCLNIIRRRKLERELRPEVPEKSKSNMALRIILRGMISDLNDPYREVIILRYYHDLTYEQIAQVLDISLSTVKTRLFRAKKTLKRMIGEENDEMR